MIIPSAVGEEGLQKVEKIRKADIIVGIPSYNNAQTIRYVAETAALGISKYLRDLKPVIVNSDGNSTDRTPQKVLDAFFPRGVERIVTPYRGIAGKGSALRAIFEIASFLDAEFCTVVEADLRSITPLWLHRLAQPLLDGYEFVVPLYIRHKFDGTITNNIAYPLTRALYGKRIRQPIGGDFGFTRKLVMFWLQQEVWHTDVARFGIDIWMTTTAINENSKICQTNLGAKLHDAKDPAQSLGPMFRQVVGTIFSLMKRYEDNWKQVRASVDIEEFGERISGEPEEIKGNQEALISKFATGFEKYKDYLGNLLGKEIMKELQQKAFGQKPFEFPLELWVKIIYLFAVKYQHTEDQQQLMESLVPLYYGRTASLVRELEPLEVKDAEERIVSWAEAYEQNKDYLLHLWESF